MPRFRTGRKVSINVYDGDEPAFQAHSVESALKLTGLLNMGWHLTQVTYDQLQNVFAESERYWGEEDFLDRLRTDVWMLLMPRDVVVTAPESAPGPTAATGQPEDGSEPQHCPYSFGPWPCVHDAGHEGPHRGGYMGPNQSGAIWTVP